ncbi:small ribosomal subunit protein mS27 isoform X2 [Denticeps clupeoides]|uniref:small ribosomal subunit protein mS27 isoform X2 n=1 Tax=Denticeps clupeoides TaxID=299321 RepID=UPI0010A58E7C|nr:28S ribosomal protein S27, mitochondrial isoform X2 [Denticeps clupeoides]
MAASIMQRCLSPVKVASKRDRVLFLARRCLLSAAYTDARIWEQRRPDPQNLAELASQMDRCYDRKFPVSSLSVARRTPCFGPCRFRHSPNCWYLRDWTVHGWVRQCLKYGGKDKAVHTLKNKVQYGIFPDDFTLNLLIDTFLKEKNYKEACSVVEEAMLQEAFDRPTTQILSLYALSKYLAAKPELSWQEQRSVGASLYLAGLGRQDPVGLSAQSMGCAMLGKIEMSRGIHAVFRQMPLMWTHGYLGRSLAAMEKVSAGAGDVKLSKDVLDVFEAVLQDLSSSTSSDTHEEGQGSESDTVGSTLTEEDEQERSKLPEYAKRFKELSSRLQTEGKVDPAGLEALASGLAEGQLKEAEGPDVAQYEQRVRDWEDERMQLIQREKESREKAEEERQARSLAKAVV